MLTNKQIKAIEELTGLRDVTNTHSIYACFSDQHKATGAGTWARRNKGHAYINMYDENHIDTWNIPVSKLSALAKILEEHNKGVNNE